MVSSFRFSVLACRALLVAMLFVNNCASATCIASGDAATLNAAA